LTGSKGPVSNSLQEIFLIILKEKPAPQRNSLS